MKTVVGFIVAGVLLCVVSTANLAAQDWKKANPMMNRILVDTTLVRAMEVTLQPKEKSDTHSHPAHFFYALTDGKLLVRYSDGATETYDLKAGDCGYSDPERPHVTENAGSGTIKFLLVELKEHPYKKK